MLCLHCKMGFYEITNDCAWQVQVSQERNVYWDSFFLNIVFLTLDTFGKERLQERNLGCSFNSSLLANHALHLYKGSQPAFSSGRPLNYLWQKGCPSLCSLIQSHLLKVRLWSFSVFSLFKLTHKLNIINIQVFINWIKKKLIVCLFYDNQGWLATIVYFKIPS